MRRSLLILLLAVSFFSGPAGADAVTMIAVADLRQEARLARAGNLILVVEFSSEYCGFCRKLEELFLLPMQRNAEYNAKVLIRSISLDAYETLIDFDGRSMSTGEFAERYDVSLTPTLLFLNADGIEMSEKLVGIWSEDFYGGFIDNRIDEAREKL
ncbi:MAG: thioredoxin fold domain-containing protein [Gammaproteobacteria bacterium]|jgi:thioredoxin-related protein|nr:thioredoxin fold domain-containing protein [Gammaproteobacteria bacterium]